MTRLVRDTTRRLIYYADPDTACTGHAQGLYRLAARRQ